MAIAKNPRAWRCGGISVAGRVGRSLKFEFRSLLIPLAAGVAGAAALALNVHAYGQTYPDRPIRLLVAFSAGGGSDTGARIVAMKMSEILGQQVVVDNRPGAGGNIATELVVRAQPDGYTLLWGFSGPIVVNPLLYKNLSFDTEKDLEPIALTASSQYILVVHPSSGVRSVKQLIAFAKDRPGQLSYASAGVGTPHHLAAELFKGRAGLDITHVMYKGGAPAAVAVMAGEVTLHFGSFSTSLPQARAGRLTALALTGRIRSPEAPDVPTMQEQGFPGFDVRSWMAMFAPARTPKPIVARLNAQLLKILAIPDVQERLRKTGVDPSSSTPQELAAYIKAEKAVWAKVIKDAGIKFE